jgi:hypothetical protein
VQLGEDAYTSSLAAGRAMSCDDAVALALRDHDSQREPLAKLALVR